MRRQTRFAFLAAAGAYLAMSRSQAEIVREAISAYRPAPKRDRNFALAGNVERIDADSRPISEIPRRADAPLRRVRSFSTPRAGGRRGAQLEMLLRIREEEGPLALPALVAAEVDYLLGVCFGHAARRRPQRSRCVAL